MAEQYNMILQTLSVYDTATITMQEATTIIQTFTATESQYYKAIYRFLLDLGFEQSKVNKVTEQYLHQALALELTEAQIHHRFSNLANFLMNVLIDSELPNKPLNEGEKERILLLIQAHANKLTFER